MVHHASKRVRPILPVFEGDRELRLVVLGVVVPVGLNGDVRAVGGGALGGLVTGEGGWEGCGEEGEGEDLEAHVGLGGVSGARREEEGGGALLPCGFGREARQVLRFCGA